jgi:hypothetical protein
MPSGEKFLAWVTPCEGEGFEAAFIAANTAPRRAPTTHGFTSPVEAKQWVERQASEMGVPVEWVDPTGVGRK